MGRAIYVSSVNGDDANSGYAPEKAFRSLRKVNQMEIQPGDQILLERGSELWRTSGQCSTYLERLSVLSGSFIRCRIHFHPESGNYKQPMRQK